jgi:two-component system OmpR family response regulator
LSGLVLAIFTGYRGEAVSESPLKIALIEDDLEMREMIAEYLGTQFKVTAFSEAHSFLQNFRNSEQFSLVISDIHMPDISGLELLKTIKEKSQSIAFMIISASSQATDQEKAIQLGAEAYLKKPFRMSQLMETAKKIVNSRHLGCR